MSGMNVETIRDEAEVMVNKSENKQQQCETNTISFDDYSNFPNGMRVLAVDDSPVCLKVVTTLLRKCRYQATEMSNMAEALMLLKQNKDKFDIVLTNVRDTGNINGFKLLEAGLEHDIPVIMTSATDDVDIVKKGVSLGARDYLIKPVRLPEIKNLWQHVVRKNLHKYQSNTNDNNNNNNNNGENEEYRIVRKKSNNSRKDDDGVTQENGEKKQRIRWDQALHDKFEEAVVKLGGVDKAVPNKIMELIDVKGITREKVASHLQKYRKSIKKNVAGVDQGDNKKKLLMHRQNYNNNSISSISTVAASEQQSMIMGGCSTVSPHYLSTAHVMGGRHVAGLDYPQLNNQWMVNHGINHHHHQIHQQLEVKTANQVVMQQPRVMHFGRNFVGVDGLMQANHIQQQQQQQQQQQNHLLSGDLRPLNSDFFDVGGKKMDDEFFDPIYENVSPNDCLLDGELQSILDEFLR